jgi:hypothetical protein
MSILLPEELHQRLQAEAHRAGVTMSEIVRRRLKSAGPLDLEEADPLLEVAGLFSDGTLCENLDEDLYEI